MIYREIVGDIKREYEGTPQEINEMLCMEAEGPIEIKPIDIVITRKDDSSVSEITRNIIDQIGRCMCSQ